LNNFGVRELLIVCRNRPITATERIETRIVDPKEEKMSGFVLKSMNMDQNTETG
jgi:peptide chain release factor 3